MTAHMRGSEISMSFLGLEMQPVVCQLTRDLLKFEGGCGKYPVAVVHNVVCTSKQEPSTPVADALSVLSFHKLRTLRY